MIFMWMACAFFGRILINGICCVWVYCAWVCCAWVCRAWVYCV